MAAQALIEILVSLFLIVMSVVDALPLILEALLEASKVLQAEFHAFATETMALRKCATR